MESRGWRHLESVAVGGREGVHVNKDQSQEPGWVAGARCQGAAGVGWGVLGNSPGLPGGAGCDQGLPPGQEAPRESAGQALPRKWKPGSRGASSNEKSSSIAAIRNIINCNFPFFPFIW